MSDQHNATRLGDILIDRGVITRQQLREAIEIQQARRFVGGNDSQAAHEKTALGEILIELGFIDRQQLTSTLSWQRRLRKATLMMTFVAPLLTAACGGGGGGGNTSGSSILDNTKPNVSSSVSSVMVDDSSSSSSRSSSSSSRSTSSAPAQASSSSSSLLNASSSMSSSLASSSLISSSAASSTPSVSLINGPVLMNWNIPALRENGDPLEVSEIGGYELRYKTRNSDTYTSVMINGGEVNSHYFNHLEGELEFQIAAFDVNGLYSRFVPIQPHLN